MNYEEQRSFDLLAKVKRAWSGVEEKGYHKVNDI